MASATIICGLNGSVSLSNSASTSGSSVAKIGDASAVCVTSSRSRISSLRTSNVAKTLSFSGVIGFNPLALRPVSRRTKVVVSSRVRAEDNGNQPEKENSIAPLVPESPSGQFLVSILRSHPHLFPAAADQQLEQLAADQNASLLEDQQNSSSTDLTLYKRIKEVKEEERRKAIEEVIYALIVQKFVEGGISLVPKIPSVSDGNVKQVEVLPSQDKALEAVHSAEALEMVTEHLTVVLGGRGTSTFLDQHTIAQISKLRVGQVYAASTMYGYFLRKVDQRFQLEKTMSGLLNSGETVEAGPVFQLPDEDRPVEAEKDSLAAEAAAAIASLQASQAGKEQINGYVNNGAGPGMKPSKLRSYVMSFDPETLQDCATMRARESLNVIEKQAEALFGKPEIKIGPDGSFKVVSDDTIKVSFSGLRRLVLEAVAFGSFLWDVETTVDSQYNLIRR